MGKHLWFAFLGVLLSATSAFADTANLADRPVEMPVYRFFYPHNFQTTNFNEGAASGMQYVGVSFYVMDRPWNNRMYPLFKCRDYRTGDYMISLYNNCEGYAFLGVLGWVNPQPTRHAQTPLYRCYARGDHYATTNLNECYQAQYQVEMLLGYITH